MSEDPSHPPTAPQESAPEAPESPAVAAPEGAPSGISPAVFMTIGFIIVVLLGIVIFQNLIPRREGGASSSPALDSLRADIQTRRAELNRERIALGKAPLPGDDAAESMDEVASRLAEDADTLASVVRSFQGLLAEKTAQLDQARAESIDALRAQRRLQDQLDQARIDLQKARGDAALAAPIQSELAAAKARIESLTAELATLRETPRNLEQQLEASRLRNEQLESQVRALEAELRRVRIFADSEKELLKEAVALFRALRQLEGSTEEALTAAYSRFGKELNAEVLDTCDFATGSATVAEPLQRRLRELPDEAAKDALLLVVGYASETGQVDQNRKLSSDRATAVARLLDTASLDSQRVQAVYLGQTDRFGAQPPNVNQRVEVWQIRPRSEPRPTADPAEPATGDDRAPPLRELPDFR